MGIGFNMAMGYLLRFRKMVAALPAATRWQRDAPITPPPAMTRLRLSVFAMPMLMTASGLLGRFTISRSLALAADASTQVRHEPTPIFKPSLATADAFISPAAYIFSCHHASRPREGR